MARVVLIEAVPWDNAGNAVNVYLAGGGSRGYDHRGRTTWVGGVVKEPKFSAAIGFDENGWTGGALPNAAKVTFAPSDKATLTSIAARQWPEASITVLVGDDATASPTWTTLQTGTVKSISVTDGKIEFTIADLGVKLNDPFIKATEKFAGTGTVEGDSDIEGRVKRRTFGRCYNIEGRVLLKASNVYEFGNPANPLSAFVAVKDKGRTASPAPTVLAWQGSIAATLTALIASTPAAGSAVVAPSIACVKWWTQPSGPLTADIDGEVGAGFTNYVVQIAGRLLGTVSGGPTYSGNLANNYRADEAGIHCDDANETTANVLDRLLLGASLTWIVDPAGVVNIREFTFTGSVETITVEAVDRVESYRPVTSRRVAYRRAYRKHSDGEISAAILMAQIDDAGALATLNNVKLGTGTGGVFQSNGSTMVTDATAITSLGTAAFFNNQAAIATDQDAVARITAMRGDNIVRNGFFNEGASGMLLDTDASYVTLAGAGQPAPYGVRFAAGVANNNHSYFYVNSGAIIPFSVNSVFMSCWVKTAVAAGIIAFAICFDAANNVIGTPSPFNVALAGSASWQFVKGGVALPANTAAIQLYLIRSVSSTNTMDVTGIRASGTAIGADVTIEQAVVSRLSPTTGRATDPRILAPVSALNLGYKFTGAVSYTATAGTPATATINVAAGSALIGSNPISYNAMSVGVTGTGGTTVTHHLYVDEVADPASWGGTKTLVATTTANNVYGSDARVYIGSVDVTFPSAGTGGGGGSGGGGYCVSADAWVETQDRGFVQAREIESGDLIRVLKVERDGVEWEPVESNMVAPGRALRIVTASGIVVTISESTPITLRDGELIRADQVDGHELPVLDDQGFRWEEAFARPAFGIIEVAHIRCNQRTYAAGDVAGRAILTHNPKP